MEAYHRNENSSSKTKQMYNQNKRDLNFKISSFADQFFAKLSLSAKKHGQKMTKNETFN